MKTEERYFYLKNEDGNIIGIVEAENSNQLIEKIRDCICDEYDVENKDITDMSCTNFECWDKYDLNIDISNSEKDFSEILEIGRTFLY